MAFYRYTLLAPLLDSYSDDGQRDLLCIHHNVPNIGEFRIALVGSPSRPEMIRSELANANAPNITHEQAWEEARLVDHLIALLSLTTDNHTTRLWIGQQTVWFDSNGDAEGKPHFGMNIETLSRVDHHKEYRSTEALFEQTVGQRDIVKLVSDAQQPQLPISYRYLSLYKVLEMEFKQAKKWPSLSNMLAPYEFEFRSLDISKRSLENHLHEVRDLCAHIKLDTRPEAQGITGFASPEYERVEKLFLLLKKIVFDHLATKFPIIVTHHPIGNGVHSTMPPGEERKSLQELHNSERAADLDRIATYWEREARNRTDKIGMGCTEFARQARFLSGLLTSTRGEAN